MSNKPNGRHPRHPGVRAPAPRELPPPTPFYHDRLVELETEARDSRRGADAVVVWGAWTFYRCGARVTIVRYGADGFEAGWHYPNPFALALAWGEIEEVARRLIGHEKAGAPADGAELWRPRGAR